MSPSNSQKEKTSTHYEHTNKQATVLRAPKAIPYIVGPTGLVLLVDRGGVHLIRDYIQMEGLKSPQEQSRVLIWNMLKGIM